MNKKKKMVSDLTFDELYNMIKFEVTAWRVCENINYDAVDAILNWLLMWGKEVKVKQLRNIVRSNYDIYMGER